MKNLSRKELETKLERVETEKELITKIKNSLLHIVDHIPGTIVYSHDTKGVFTRISKGSKEIFGLEPKEIVGKKWRDVAFMSQTNIPLENNLNGKIFNEGEQLIYELELERPEKRILEIRETPFKDEQGNIVAIEGLGIDITKNKALTSSLENALTSEKKKFDLFLSIVFDTFPAGVIMAKPPNIEINYANQAALSIATNKSDKPNMTLEETFGEWEAYASSGEKLEYEDWPLYRAIIYGEESSNRELILKKTNKNSELEEKIVMASASPIKKEDGEITAGVLLFSDITTTKKLESQLRQSQKMEAIGTLAGGISHDFNNILAGIIGYSDILKLSLQKSENLGYVQQISKAADRAKELVKQILTLSRQTEQEPMPLKLNPIVQEALKLLRSSIPASIKINQKIPNQSYVITADPTQIHQVIMNLCTNASYAMGDRGEIDVSIDKAELLNDSKLPNGEYVEIKISDTGSGIPYSIQQKIFNPYFTTKPFGEGTGLGLSVVHSIVENHKGTIKLESSPNVGTIFKVYFPISKENIMGSEIKTQSQLVKGLGRILTADDEEHIRTYYEEMLSKLGYTVNSYSQGQELVDAYLKNPNMCDAIITDFTMPGELNGFDVTRKIRETDSNIPIILCSGHPINTQEAQQKGVDYVLFKPVNAELISRTIKSALETKLK